MKTYYKAPFEEIVRDFNWSDRMVSADKLTSSSWEIDNGLTGANGLFDDDSTQIELSGGTAGTQYLVTNKVTTQEGEAYQRSFYILVRER